MQTAVGRHRCGHEIFYLIRYRYIGLDEDSLTLLPFDHLYRLDTRWVVVADNNLRTMLRKQNRCGLTDPTAPARNHRDLP